MTVADKACRTKLYISRSGAFGRPKVVESCIYCRRVYQVVLHAVEPQLSIPRGVGFASNFRTQSILTRKFVDTQTASVLIQGMKDACV